MNQKFTRVDASKGILVEEYVTGPFIEATANGDLTIATGASSLLVSVEPDGKVVAADKGSYVTMCSGYITENVGDGAATKVFISGEVNGSGLTPGKQLFLTDNGAYSETPPTAIKGGILQVVGRALSATKWAFNPEQPIERVV